MQNDGYVLGLPFVRAYMLVFDYEANTISLATKQQNYGAVITSKREPNAPKTHTAPVEPEPPQPEPNPTEPSKPEPP